MRFPRYPWTNMDRVMHGERELLGFIGSDAFKNDMLFSSPALLEQIERLLAGRITNKKDAEKVLVSAFKYIARMSARCTPFASLASCAVAGWGETNSLIVSDTLEQDFRIDMLYQCRLAQHIQGRMMKALRYRSNETLYLAGNKYRYVSSGTRKSRRFFHIREVMDNGLLSYVLEKTSSYRPFDEITAMVMDVCDCAADDAERYVELLIHEQILMSEILPHVTGQDMLSTLLEMTSRHEMKECNEELLTISSVLKEFDIGSSFSANLDARDRIKTFFMEKRIPVQEKFLIQLDTYRPMSSATVDDALKKQLMQGLSLLSALTPNHRHGLLENFKKRFQERYEEREIPLLEALDPDMGVGFIVEEDKIASRLIEGIRLPAKKSIQSVSLTPLVRLLLSKLYEYNPSDDGFIEITDKDISQLEYSYNDLPLSMSAMFSLLDYDRDKREYLIGGLHFTGSSGANMLGRFADGNEQIKQLVESVARSEKSAYRDEIIAEITHIPESRTGNILHRPHVRDYEIAYLSNTTLDEEHRIPVNDLLVSVTGGRIVLRSKRLGREIVPRLTTAHNYSQSKLTPVYRFLCNMQHQTGRMSLNFSWQGLEQAFDSLPQVRYGNIILKPAQWRIRTSEMPFKRSVMEKDMAIVESWCLKKRLPQHILLVSGDNKLPIDMKNRLGVEAMLSEISETEQFVVEEFLPSKNVAVDGRGRSHMNECIIPFIKVRQ